MDNTLHASEGDAAALAVAIAAIISTLSPEDRGRFAAHLETIAARARDLVSDLPLAEDYFQAFDGRIALFRAYVAPQS